MTTAEETTISIRQDLTQDAYWDLLNRKSVSRFFLLSALHRKPQHGYELKKSIGECCPGAEPTDAMIYPTLKALLEGGYIVCDEEAPGGTNGLAHPGRPRKVCRLTPKGVAAYEAAARAWARMLPYLQTCVEGVGCGPSSPSGRGLR